MPETSDDKAKSGGTPSIEPPRSSSALADTAGRSGGTLHPGPDAPLVAEKYRVVKELGRGGMGAVYEAEHEITKHRRALKIVNKAGSGEHLQRLLREASAAGRVQNAHIVETLDAGTLNDGQGFIVMELLEGMTLFEYLRTRDRSKITDLVDLIGQACDGLHAAHEVGIVHRDVKPGNLFVTKRDGKPFVKIVDFGVSKFDPVLTEQTEITSDGALLGTPAYMAPEQIRGEGDVDRRTDIYALGIILYAATAGERPFRGRTFGDMAVAIANGEHVPLGERRPDLPAAFCATVEKAMACKRDDRHATAKELAEDLRATLKRDVALPAAELTVPLPDPAPPPPPNPALRASMSTIREVAPSDAPAPAKPRWGRLAVLVVAGLAIGGAIMIAAKHRSEDREAKPAASTTIAADPSASTSVAPPASAPIATAATTATPATAPTAPTAQEEPPAKKPATKATQAPVPPPKPSATASGKVPLNRSNPYQ